MTRILHTRAEAAEMLSMSVDHLDRHVMPHLRVVLSGRLRLVPASELERFVTERQTFVG